MRYVVIALALIGCGTDSAPPGGGGGGGGGDGGGGGGGAMMVSGTISSDQTWTGSVDVSGALTIASGATVTVEAGTTIATGAAISVDGTLDIEGTSGMTVAIAPAGTATRWTGFYIKNGGTLTAHYMAELGGTIQLVDGATATITDSTMSHAGAGTDLVVLSGGTLDIEYSSIGVETGQTDNTHCDTHFNAATSIKITHTNLSSSAYGSMFYAGSSVDWTYDNWFDNSIDVDITPGVTGTFSNGWFKSGKVPSGSGIVADNMSATRVTDAGPRP
ncbi:MAG TPA: hypothetical protein VGF94_13285 [Kofleriaceae bacterium]|jgi:hypothetical protein